MGIHFCGLLLLAICTARTIAPESCLASEYKDEVSVALWESLFTKINTILSETSRLGESQNALSESFAELKEKHEAQGRKLAQFMEDTERHFSKLEDRQILQTSKTTELLKSAEEDFKGMQEGLAEQQRKLSYLTVKYFLDNTEDDWITIVRRQDGSVNFNRNWIEYKNGFGKADGEFFIGLEKLHILTSNGAPQKLLIILKDYNNERRIAKYDLFRIGNEAEKYALLELGEYSGDAGDSLIQHKGMNFSTPDQDNDTNEKGNCAEYRHAAWWFHNCQDSNLLGIFHYYGFDVRIYWKTWKDNLKFVEMKIRSNIIKA